jgi:hypothetical protein
MLENIVAHSLQVCRVATCLADYLKLEGIDLDRQLVQADTRRSAIWSGSMSVLMAIPKTKVFQKLRLSIMPTSECATIGSCR